MNTSTEQFAGHIPGDYMLDNVPIQSSGGSNTCFRIGSFNACIYDDWRQVGRGFTREQIAATARLLAAAPQLLAERDALRAALENVCNQITASEMGKNLLACDLLLDSSYEEARKLLE